MEWKLLGVEQETNHRFLNYYVLSYQVKRDGKDEDYTYFIASRRAKEDLVAMTSDYSRPDGVLIMAVKEDENGPSVLMIDQFRPGINVTVMEFPAGLLDPEDDDAIMAARREAIEEAGVELTDVRLLCPASPTSVGMSDEMLAVVEGKVVGLTEKHLERFEDIAASFIPLKELRCIVADPHFVMALNVRLCLYILLERYHLL